MFGLKKACRNPGIFIKLFHDLRHTAASFGPRSLGDRAMDSQTDQSRIKKPKNSVNHLYSWAFFVPKKLGNVGYI